MTGETYYEIEKHAGQNIFLVSKGKISFTIYIVSHDEGKRASISHTN